MTITYHPDVEQGTPEWLEMRRGLLTASEVKLILTPTLKIARNDKTRQHVYELAAQRITEYVEPTYIGDDMLRGWEDEVRARDLYSAKYAPVTECGFVTNDEWGFTIGYSPDGLVGDDGLIEIKSRRQKYQIETIVTGEVPTEHYMQCQTGLLVTGRKWLDYISYSGGIPMCRVRVFPDEATHISIIEAAHEFDAQVGATVMAYEKLTSDENEYPPTERVVEQEMHMGDAV